MQAPITGDGGVEAEEQQAAMHSDNAFATKAPPALCAELAALKNSELKKRAKASGASEEQLDDVDDAIDQRAALVALIVALEAAPTPLREELAAFKNSELKKRAKAGGASDEQLDGVDDAPDQRTALIDLIVAMEATPAGSVLREELATLKISELKKRAKAGGASEPQLDDVDDAPDQRAALADLVVALEVGGGGGAPPSPALAPAPAVAAGGALALPAELMGVMIFISYFAKESKELFHSLVSLLTMLGCKVFQPAQDLVNPSQQEMRDAVANSDLVLSIWSLSYFTSKWCRLRRTRRSSRTSRWSQCLTGTNRRPRRSWTSC